MALAAPRTRLRLRARLTLAFGLGALLLSTLLSAVAYGLTRDNLLDGREADAVVVTSRNARRIGATITEETDQTDLREILGNQTTIADAIPVIQVRRSTGFEWISGDPEAFGAPTDINANLLMMVSNPVGASAAHMRYKVQDDPYLVIGVPLSTGAGTYVEAVPLSDIEDTLSSLGLALLGASSVTTLAGVGLGTWASRRVLSPIEDVSATAEALASGDLSARLEVEGDRDLAPLAASFNEMAANLEERIERDARFASDVSHELRSPLMTIMASVEVLNSRRDELSDRAQTALDLLTDDLARFRQLVEDLLEISRYDTSGGSLESDHFGIVEFVIRAAREADHDEIPVTYPPEMAETVVEADKRRLARVIANLLANAKNYAGGASAIELRQFDNTVEIAVEDGGPGVPEEERQLIFSRFARGSEGGRRGAGTGTGLGLALVVEHVRLHGGRVRVDDRPDGEPGARFVVELPVVSE